MGDRWITDIQHFLEDGEIPEALPSRALAIVLHLGSIVSWVTSRRPTGVERTNVTCRRSPGRRRCLGEILAKFESREGAILWQCPVCDDQGRITGWRGTRWDRSAPDESSGRVESPAAIAGSEGEPKRIAAGNRVPVPFSARERDLLVDLCLDGDYIERLRPVPGSKDLTGEFTLDDLEDILGYVAAEANHTDDTRLRKRLDGLFDRLSRIQRSYDDGNWGDSLV